MAATETKVIESRVMHRFIQPIAEYELGGIYYKQVIALNTQAYAMYDTADKQGLYFVLGDGIHTYVEIRDGKSNLSSAREYPVFSNEFVALINTKANKQETDNKLALKQNISNIITEINEENGNSTTLYTSARAAKKYTDSEINTLDTDLSAKILELNTNKADKINVYTKTEIDSKLTTVFKYCGSVKTFDDLPSTNLHIGDIYNIEQADSTHDIKAGDNVAWNGTAWDNLRGVVDLSTYMLIATYEADIQNYATKQLLTDKITAVDNTITNSVSTLNEKDEELSTKISDEETRAKNNEQALLNVINQKANASTLDLYYTSEECDDLFLTEHQDISSKASIEEVNTLRVTVNANTADIEKEITDRESADNQLQAAVDNLSENKQDKGDYAQKSYVLTACTDFSDAVTGGILDRIWSTSSSIDDPNVGYFETIKKASDGSYAKIWNEPDGGGAQYYNAAKDSLHFVGVNDGEDGVCVQIYAKNKTSNIGARLAASPSGIYYTNGKANGSYELTDEVVTKKTIATLETRIADLEARLAALENA